ncbi:MAG: glutamine synthetase, partial [Burkholderiales bacterium]
MSLVERHGLWSDEQRAAAAAALKEIRDRKLQVVRFSFADQHGILRGKTLAAGEVATALENGVTLTSTLLLKDTSHRTVFAAFTPGGGIGIPELQGAADVLMVADPLSFRVLPWAADTGWFQCEIYFHDGRPVPLDTRPLLRRTLETLRKAGYEYLAGLEVEFHVFRIEHPHLRPADAGQPGEPPEVSLLSTGYQYLTEQRYDLIDP